MDKTQLREVHAFFHDASDIELQQRLEQIQRLVDVLPAGTEDAYEARYLLRLFKEESSARQCLRRYHEQRKAGRI